MWITFTMRITKAAKEFQFLLPPNHHYNKKDQQCLLSILSSIENHKIKQLEVLYAGMREESDLYDNHQSIRVLTLQHTKSNNIYRHRCLWNISDYKAKGRRTTYQRLRNKNPLSSLCLTCALRSANRQRKRSRTDSLSWLHTIEVDLWITLEKKKNMDNDVKYQYENANTTIWFKCSNKSKPKYARKKMPKLIRNELARD